MAKYTCRLQVMLDEDTFVKLCNKAFNSRETVSPYCRTILEKEVSDE